MINPHKQLQAMHERAHPPENGKRQYDTQIHQPLLETSDSDCSCSSCESYQLRKERLRPAMRTWLRQEKDDSGEEALDNGWLSYRYGRYGFLDPADRTMKTPEYNAWLVEVKKVAWENLTAFEDKQCWQEYVDAYNMATMPSKRFYDLNNCQGRAVGRLEARADVAGSSILAVDEAERRELARRVRQHERDTEIQKVLEEMKDNQLLAQAIQQEREFRTKLSLMFKTGETEQARQLHQLARHKLVRTEADQMPPSDQLTRQYSDGESEE